MTEVTGVQTILLLTFTDSSFQERQDDKGGINLLIIELLMNMKQMMKIGLVAAICSLLVACGTDPVEQWLSCAEACMEVNADSARRCLLYIEDLDECDDEQRAHYALLWTQAMHKCRIPLDGDSLINTAVAYYENSHDRHRLALSLLYKGLVHKQNHQVEQAVEAFVSSEQAFDDVEDNQYKALLYNHHGALLMSQGVYEEALGYYKGAYQYNLLDDSVHYVVSNCGQIANVYIMMDMPDSANAYYERGMSYKDSLSDGKKRNYYLLLQNYATFLMRGENYAEAERLLQECLENMNDSNYLHTLYAALTTLYYEKREFETALTYGKRVIESTDSLTACGGYLRLYKIYKDMGEMDSAYHCHNLYRQYNSDISLRRQVVAVATIPHKMKMAQMAEENRTLAGWRIWLVVGLLAVTALWWGIYRTIQCRHRREQGAKEQELAAKEGELESVGNKYGKTSAELGRLKGALANHVDAMERLKKEHQTILDNHREEIKGLKKNVEELKKEIRDQKKTDRVTLRTENELKRTLQKMEQELKKRADRLSEAEHQHEIDRRIEHFVASGECKRAVDMLLGLRLKRKVDVRYDIGREEYHYLMMQLLELENPALYARLEQCELDKKKRTLCCMIALGLDDIDMMAEAVCLSPYTVKDYCRECREVIDSSTTKSEE